MSNLDDNTVTVLGLTTIEPFVRRINTINVGERPENVAITPNGELALVVNQQTAGTVGTVTVLDIDGTTVTARSNPISVSGSPNGVAINLDGTLVLVVDESTNAVSVLDLTSSPIIENSTVSVGNNPRRVAIGPIILL